VTLKPDLWQRIVASARRVPVEDGHVSAPPGFATRVVALAMERMSERPLLGLVERFSWRALGVAAGLAVASALVNFVPARQAFKSTTTIEQDPVAIVLDLSR